MKKKYETPQAEVIRFATQDIIMASAPDDAYKKNPENMYKARKKEKKEEHWKYQVPDNLDTIP